MGTRIYINRGVCLEIDETAQVDIINDLQRAKKETETVKRANLSDLINLTARESNIREGSCGRISELSISTMFRTIMRLNMSTVAPPTITNPRLHAELDIQNYVVDSVAQHALMNTCDPYLVINADSTAFGVFGSGSSKVARVGLNDDLEPVTIEKGHGGTLGIYAEGSNQISLGF